MENPSPRSPLVSSMTVCSSDHIGIPTIISNDLDLVGSLAILEPIDVSDFAFTKW